MKFTLALMSELEDALQSGAPERRVVMLRRITDLFLSDANRLNEEQVGVFDEILTHLAHRIEERVLSQISLKFAPVRNAPKNMKRESRLSLINICCRCHPEVELTLRLFLNSFLGHGSH